MSPHFASMSPKARRMLITVCAMTATIMQALDTTIANVALPYMQGSLSASLDQINWVLTSYIVAAAIMTAPVGWMADRFGRKKLFIICVTGFTIASFLCALAQNIEQMVLFRLLQGMAGAALVPLSQSTLLDAYSVEERGSAMAIWGVGVMLGPIMGPTLGAWLTDNYSWHWVFLINLPIGVITVVGMVLFMEETDRHEHLRFDWFGFLALAVGIGSLQLLLDRGEQVGWFGASEIWVEMIVSLVGFYYFFAHSLTTTFEVRIPVSTKEVLLWPEENAYAILKWRLERMNPANRWHPVLKRYVSIIAGRIWGLGGDPGKIPPSPTGYHPPPTGGPGGGTGRKRHALTGKVIGVVFNRFGDFEGFRFLTLEGRERSFRGREREVERLVYKAWEEEILVSLELDESDAEWPAAIVYVRP